MIGATRVQAALTRAGFPWAHNGIAGPRTWCALFAYAASRPADATLTAFGDAAAQ